VQQQRFSLTRVSNPKILGLLSPSDLPIFL
jgi:hypothetical protein